MFLQIRNKIIQTDDVMDVEVDFSEMEIRFFLKNNNILKTITIDYSEDKFEVNEEKQPIQKDYEMIQEAMCDDLKYKRLNELRLANQYAESRILELTIENEGLKNEIKELKKEETKAFKRFKERIKGICKWKKKK